PAPSVYRSSSPFGAHYHSSDPAFAHHAGIWWWRNHDVYGRWNFYLSSAGKTDWSDYEERLELCGGTAPGMFRLPGRPQTVLHHPAG
ncbi:hypothetical protein, partial [Victivallis vadensis]|uniref:hypothetical protein n=1 Tax=Victivallis vadensis TaxID=172901 RepID=UPI00164E5949